MEIIKFILKGKMRNGVNQNDIYICYIYGEGERKHTREADWLLEQTVSEEAIL